MSETQYTSIKVPKEFVRSFIKKSKEPMYRSFSEFALECIRNQLDKMENKLT